MGQTTTLYTVDERNLTKVAGGGMKSSVRMQKLVNKTITNSQKKIKRGLPGG